MAAQYGLRDASVTKLPTACVVVEVETTSCCPWRTSAVDDEVVVDVAVVDVVLAVVVVPVLVVVDVVVVVVLVETLPLPELLVVVPVPPKS
jgi:hypothetical protein